MKLLTEQKEIHRLRKHTYGFQGEGIVRDFGKVITFGFNNQLGFLGLPHNSRLWG